MKLNKEQKSFFWVYRRRKSHFLCWSFCGLMYQSKDITHCLEAGECVMYFSTANTMYPHSPGKSLEKSVEKNSILFLYALGEKYIFYRRNRVMVNEQQYTGQFSILKQLSQLKSLSCIYVHTNHSFICHSFSSTSGIFLICMCFLIWNQGTIHMLQSNLFVQKI